MIAVHEGIQVPITHAHKFVPGTDTLIEKSIVSARIQGDGPRPTGSMIMQRLTPRGVNEPIQHLVQGHHPHGVVHRNILQESQIHQHGNLPTLHNQEISQKHNDHTKIPEYVQSHANLLPNPYGTGRNNQQDIQDLVLAENKLTDHTVKTYETFGRKLVTPNSKHPGAVD